MRGEHNNETLLHLAAQYNRPSCISVLLRLTPHLVDAVEDKYNDTALMIAVVLDNRDAAKMLRRAGADVRTKRFDGYTVFDYARNRK